MKKNFPLLIMRGIKKAFPGVVALDNVTIDVDKGEVIALIGENGAGKSTLIKILSGAYQKDSGEVIFEGKNIDIRNSMDSVNLGINTIYQEVNTVPFLTVYENIFLGREVKARFGLISKSKMLKKARELLNNYDIDIDPESLMSDLSIANIQMVLIAKALEFESKIIIMDEPTAFLTSDEVEKLFGIIKYLKKKGVSVIYISHNLEEIFKITDRIFVLRDGKNIGGAIKIKNIKIDLLVEKMVGRSIKDYYPQRISAISDKILEVKDFNQEGKFKDISFELHKGEVLGIYGLVGAGRTEIAESIYGIIRNTSPITIEDKKVKITSPAKAIREGICLLPEDRKEQGLILGMTVRENISLSQLDKHIKFGFLSPRSENKTADEYINKINIKVTNREQVAGNLSGGNQQKVVVAKWLQVKPKILIMDEPTKGIDVGAKVEIYNLINNLVKSGVAIILISSDLPEVLAMSDRIMVLSEGKITKFFNKNEATPENILKYATGLMN